MESIQIESWQTLPSEGGQWIALKDDRVAIAGTARLCVWVDRRKILTVDAPTPSPGMPRFAGDKIYWGSGFADLKTGIYTLLEIAKPAVRPGGGEVPFVYEWSPDGDCLVGVFSNADLASPVRVSLFNRHELTVTPIWQEKGIPPGSVWFGKRTIVVGFGNPRVSDRSGKHIADIAMDGSTIIFIGSTFKEERIVIVDLNRGMFLINTANWRILDRWPGPWIHGAISPDGRFAAVLEPWGKVHVACLGGDLFNPVSEEIVDSNAVSIALTDDRIFITGGGEFHWANLKVKCSSDQ